jgi:hypothetical protein
MASRLATTYDDLISGVETPGTINIDCSSVNKGIDNFHIDVQLSEVFVLLTGELVEEQVKLIVNGKRLTPGNTQQMADFRDAYSDMVSVTLHRSKTDLSISEIAVLQFAIVKFVISEVRTQLKTYGDQLETTLGQQQFDGSRRLLTTQERLQWYRKFSSTFMFRINRQLLRQLQREEINRLKKLRNQVLGSTLPGAVNILFNPMLFGRSPQEPLLLLDYYSFWPSAGFSKLNEAIEEILRTGISSLNTSPLMVTEKLDAAQSEVYDELDGLFGVQLLLGPSKNQKERLSETFGWLEQPGNLPWLFDDKLLQKQLDQVKSDGGIKAGWDFKSDIKKLRKVFAQICKTLTDQFDARDMVAGHLLSEHLTQQHIELLDIAQACAFVAGKDEKKILGLIDDSKEGAAALVDKLKDVRESLNVQLKEAGPEHYLKILTNLARYRLHLKYFRFAHRMFNRINVISDPEKIQLAKAGGNLYRLMNTEEVKEIANEQPDIVHHTILKADVRGSTTVTQELNQRGLNPASYFSLRFFGPITERLSIYGAVKVFIEGDAVILGFYEYDDNPANWYSVAWSCGMAKEMIDIVNLQNAENTKAGLPTLEIGIGICYLKDRPVFLYDENRPIMISSAIGDADRMSSCSWKLRDSFEADQFNVEVLEIAETDQQRGEKGQDHIRYNVNGILLDDAAFNKLKTEIAFDKLKLKVGENSESFLVGKFPDVGGKLRDLIIREGSIGTWDGKDVHRGDVLGGKFYEVLPNSKFAAKVLEARSK